MVPAEPTLRQVAVRTAVDAVTRRLQVAGAVTPHLRVVAALIPPPAADVAIPPHEAVVVVAAEAAIVPAAVVATAADIDKLALLVSPQTGAAAGTSTQPATAPAFLLGHVSGSKSLQENQRA